MRSTIATGSLGVKILLVSSGPALTRHVTAALPADADVLEVRTPQRGLAVLDEGEHSFDVILGDADTHPTGGFHLVRELRARQTDGADVPPIVLLIARPQDQYLARWAQADAWIVKPVDPFDLAEVLEALGAGNPVPALPGVGTLGHAPQLGPGGGTSADRALVGATPPELSPAPAALEHSGDRGRE
jgi:CheY-like chemotaxis protein